jgi:hypothetical protein
MKPAQIPKMKYKEPMSLWFVDTNQRKEEETEGVRNKDLKIKSPI